MIFSRKFLKFIQKLCYTAHVLVFIIKVGFMQYPIAIFQKDKNYHVNVPDIPELSASGDNMAEVIANARMAVITHLHELIENDQKIPQALSISTYLNEPEFLGCTWAIISVELTHIMGESIDLELQLPVRLFKQATQKFPDESIDKIIISALKNYLEQ